MRQVFVCWVIFYDLSADFFQNYLKKKTIRNIMSMSNGLISDQDTFPSSCCHLPGLEVIKLEFILRLKIKRNDWLFADTCPQAANHCALF